MCRVRRDGGCGGLVAIDPKRMQGSDGIFGNAGKMQKEIRSLTSYEVERLEP